MFFKAVFSHWVNDEEPAIETVSLPEELEKALSQDHKFIIEAENKEKASAIAKKYEGLETHAHEGIGELKSLTVADERDRQHLQPITIYADYLPEAVEEKNRKIREAWAEIDRRGLKGKAAREFLRKALGL